MVGAFQVARTPSQLLHCRNEQPAGRHRLGQLGVLGARRKGDYAILHAGRAHSHSAACAPTHRPAYVCCSMCSPHSTAVLLSRGEIRQQRSSIRSQTREGQRGFQLLIWAAPVPQLTRLGGGPAPNRNCREVPCCGPISMATRTPYFLHHRALTMTATSPVSAKQRAERTLRL